MTTDFMNFGEEFAVCQALGIVLDICPTCHILDYFMLNILEFFFDEFV